MGDRRDRQMQDCFYTGSCKPCMAMASIATTRGHDLSVVPKVTVCCCAQSSAAGAGQVVHSLQAGGMQLQQSGWVHVPVSHSACYNYTCQAVASCCRGLHAAVRKRFPDIYSQLATVVRNL